MEFVGRRVSLVRLAQPTHITGLGNLTTVVTADIKSLGKAVLTYVEGGVHLQVGKIEAILPVGNIVSIEFKPL